MFTISDKTVKFLLNYNYRFWGPLVIGTRCILLVIIMHMIISHAVIMLLRNFWFFCRVWNSATAFTINISRSILSV